MAFPARASRLPAPSLARRSTRLPVPSPASGALDAAFARFLRLDVANGAARDTIRSDRGQVGAWVAWCSGNQVDPGTAAPDHVKTYRQDLVLEGYAPGTIANELTVLCRFYQAAAAADLRQDNPAAVTRPPREKKAAEDFGYLSEVDLTLLFRAAPPLDKEGPAARSRILALFGLQGPARGRDHRATENLRARMTRP